MRRELVERTGDRSLHAGPVVAPDPQNERVVELPELLDGVDDASDVVVGVLREPGIDLHLAGVEGPQILGDPVPGREGRVARGQLGVRRDHPELLLTGERLLAQLVPALVELTLVLVGPRVGHVMRRMATARGEVQEERLGGVLGADAMEPLDGPIRHGVGEVVRVVLVVVALRSPDDLLVLGQAGIPLARPSTQEPVEVVEAPAVRPTVERTGRALLAVGCEMPFSDDGGAVTVVPQDPRKRRAVTWQCRRVPGEAASELPDGAEAHRVIVPSGQQRGPGRRAQSGHMEAVVAKAPVSQTSEVGRLYRPPECTRIPKAGVVDQNEEHIGSARRRHGVSDEVPIGLRTVQCLPHCPCEGRSADGEALAVELGHGQRPFSERRWRFSSDRVGAEAPFGTVRRVPPGGGSTYRGPADWRTWVWLPVTVPRSQTSAGRAMM